MFWSSGWVASFAHLKKATHLFIFCSFRIWSPGVRMCECQERGQHHDEERIGRGLWRHHLLGLWIRVKLRRTPGQQSLHWHGMFLCGCRRVQNGIHICRVLVPTVLCNDSNDYCLRLHGRKGQILSLHYILCDEFPHLQHSCSLDLVQSRISVSTWSHRRGGLWTSAPCRGCDWTGGNASAQAKTWCI